MWGPLASNISTQVPNVNSGRQTGSYVVHERTISTTPLAKYPILRPTSFIVMSLMHIIGLNGGVGNERVFLRVFRQRMVDCYMQDWNSKLSESDRFFDL